MFALSADTSEADKSGDGISAAAIIPGATNILEVDIPAVAYIPAAADISSAADNSSS